MKCNFYTSPAMMGWTYFLTLFTICVGAIAIILFFKSILLNACLALLVLALILVLNMKKGLIEADEEKVYISRYFFGQYIFRRSIAYYDIDSFKCHTELIKGKYRVKYVIITTIKVSNGDELVYYSRISVDEGMPVNNPDKFQKIVGSHPAMQLREYVSKNIRACLEENKK